MGNYLVTGAAGFIGSAVAAALAGAGHSVTGLDNLSAGCKEAVPPGIRFVMGDCLDERVFSDSLGTESFDAIFHLAGQDDKRPTPGNPLKDLLNNAAATLRLLCHAETTGCPRFIYGSSGAVYGPQPDAPVKEDAPLHPTSFSGVSKLAAEQYLWLYEGRGVSSTSLRFFSVYGPSRKAGAGRSMVDRIMAMMVNEGHIHVRGTPNRCRDFVYIDDAVQALLACLERPASQGRAINVGGSGKVMVGDLVDMICALSDSPVTVEYSGYAEGEDFGNHADIASAAKYLGYEAEIGLHAGLSRMYAWFKDAGTER